MSKITIDDIEYETDDMTDEAKGQLGSLQFVNGEIQRLQAQVAAMRTAGNAYTVALGKELKVID